MFDKCEIKSSTLVCKQPTLGEYIWKQWQIQGGAFWGNFP